MPTVVIGSAKDIVESCSVARFLFTDHPLGSPCGEPGNSEMQSRVLEEAFALLETATVSPTTVTASTAWPDGHGWKEKLMTEEQPFLEGEVFDHWMEAKEKFRAAKEAAKQKGND